MFLRIMDNTSDKKAWNTIQEEFLGSIKVLFIKLQTLKHECELINWKSLLPLKTNILELKKYLFKWKHMWKIYMIRKLWKYYDFYPL